MKRINNRFTLPWHWWVIFLIGVNVLPDRGLAEGDFTTLLKRSKGRGAADWGGGSTLIEASIPGGVPPAGGIRNIVDIEEPAQGVGSDGGGGVVPQHEAEIGFEQRGGKGETGGVDGSKSVRVWQLDPRSSISADQFAGSPFEPTELTVERALLAAEFADGVEADAEPEWKQRILISIPVIHRSRTLSWSAKDVAEAKEIASRLRAHLEKSKALRAEAEQIIADWRALVRRGTPESVLGVDSPSLVANESDSELVRGEPEQGFEAGKGLIFNVIERAAR